MNSLTNNEGDGYWLADYPHTQEELKLNIRLGASAIFGPILQPLFYNYLPGV